MRRIAAIALAAVVVLVGCEVEEEPAEDRDDRPTEEASPERDTESEPDPEPASDTPDLSEGNMEDILLIVLREQEPGFEDYPDDLILDTAHATCDVLDAGGTIEQIAATGMSSSDLTVTELGALTGAAIAALCPEYQDEIDAFAAEYD